MEVGEIKALVFTTFSQRSLDASIYECSAKPRIELSVEKKNNGSTSINIREKKY